MKISFNANNLVDHPWVINHGFRISKDYVDSGGKVIRQLVYVYDSEAPLDNLAAGCFIKLKYYNQKGRLFRSRTLTTRAHGIDLVRLSRSIRRRQIDYILALDCKSPIGAFLNNYDILVNRYIEFNDPEFLSTIKEYEGMTYSMVTYINSNDEECSNTLEQVIIETLDTLYTGSLS